MIFEIDHHLSMLAELHALDENFTKDFPLNHQSRARDALFTSKAAMASFNSKWQVSKQSS